MSSSKLWNDSDDCGSSLTKPPLSCSFGVAAISGVLLRFPMVCVVPWSSCSVVGASTGGDAMSWHLQDERVAVRADTKGWQQNFGGGERTGDDRRGGRVVIRRQGIQFARGPSHATERGLELSFWKSPTSQA